MVLPINKIDGDKNLSKGTFYIENLYFRNHRVKIYKLN